MTVTVLDRIWEIEARPASPNQAPNAVYLQVRHKPRQGEPRLLPGGIVFGLTELEAHRIARALIEATNPGEATEILRSFQPSSKTAQSLAEKPSPSPTSQAGKLSFTVTQGRYLAFIHRYITKFGRAPAEADIQRHFLVSAPSVNAMMKTLTQKRLISRVPGAPRSIRLLVPPELLPDES